MKLIVKNKFASLTGASYVRDDSGKDLFKVKGKLKLFSPTRKKKIYDMEGNRLYTVRNKWFNFFFNSAYIYDADKNKIAKLKTGFTRTIVSQDEEFEDTYKIARNPEGRGRAIYKNDQVIGVWRNTKLHFVDTFEVEYENADDAAILVALMIAVDNIGDKILED